MEQRNTMDLQIRLLTVVDILQVMFVYIQLIQNPNQGAYLRISKITSTADTYCKSVTSVSGTKATKSVGSKVTNGSTVDVYRTIKCSKHGTTKLSARVGGW